MTGQPSGNHRAMSGNAGDGHMNDKVLNNSQIQHLQAKTSPGFRFFTASGNEQKQRGAVGSAIFITSRQKCHGIRKVYLLTRPLTGL